MTEVSSLETDTFSVPPAAGKSRPAGERRFPRRHSRALRGLVSDETIVAVDLSDSENAGRLGRSRPRRLQKVHEAAGMRAASSTRM